MASKRKFAKTDDLLKPHGRVWNVIDKHETEPTDLYEHATRFKVLPFQNPETILNPIECLYFMLPTTIITDGVNNTNRCLLIDKQPITDKGEFLTFLGLTAAMSADPMKGNINGYWNNLPKENSTLLHRDFGKRFGMSRNRFKMIRHCLSFTNKKPDTTIVSIYFLLLSLPA